MVRVIYSPEAEDDLQGIVSYITRDNPQAARDWLARIRQACETFSTHPELGEVRKGFGVPNSRFFSLGNYMIFYRPTDEGIEIARVIHGARDMRKI